MVATIRGPFRGTPAASLKITERAPPITAQKIPVIRELFCNCLVISRENIYLAYEIPVHGHDPHDDRHDLQYLVGFVYLLLTSYSLFRAAREAELSSCSISIPEAIIAASLSSPGT